MWGNLYNRRPDGLLAPADPPKRAVGLREGARCIALPSGSEGRRALARWGCPVMGSGSPGTRHGLALGARPVVIAIARSQNPRSPLLPWVPAGLQLLLIPPVFRYLQRYAGTFRSLPVLLVAAVL